MPGINDAIDRFACARRRAGPDAEMSEPGGDYYELLRGPFKVSAADGRRFGLTPDDKRYLRQVAGVVILSRSKASRFPLSVSWCGTAEDLDELWNMYRTDIRKAQPVAEPNRGGHDHATT